jgi:hypothetical protein
MAKAWEYDDLTIRMMLSIACAVVIVLAGAAWFVHQGAAPACDSDRAQSEVYQVLRDQFHLEGVFLHNFKPVSGGYFSATRNCAAEVAEIRGNVSAEDMRWRQVRYRIAHADGSENTIATVDLGHATPFLQPPEVTLWARVRSYF